MYANVLVEYTSKAIDKEFTYLIPDNLKNKVQIGSKVLIPFGNKTINGFVTNILSQTNLDKIKAIIDVINEEIILNKEQLSLGKYLSDATLCTKIMAYETMLPSALKINKKAMKSNYITYLRLNKDTNVINDYINNHSRNKAQIKILNDLLINLKIIATSYNKEAIKKLISLNLIKEEKEDSYKINKDIKKINSSIVLNNDQKQALNNIKLNYNQTYLLYGVTGSGKTEVYMHLIDKVIHNNQTALMIVPEIALTTQVINNFYERFGNDVAVFHSGLSNSEKRDEYLKIYRGKTKIVVGTRSAIFVPLINLGVIIIDEEQSDTYHQEENPRYSVISMAKFRSSYNKCPLILGSATPTLEAMARAKKGVYTMLSLPNRIGNVPYPQVILVDMQDEMKHYHPIISRKLETKIKERLQKKEQVMLLLNRRGYSTIVSCHNCGYTIKCPKCDISLTYHKNTHNLRCHYCGYTIFLPNSCPHCKEDALSYLGLGTEKLEQELNKMFPSAKILRMDIDTTANKGMHEKIIKAFKNHEADILVGTQMISKGLDFKNVSLVGVINADTSLNIPDFRSGERTFSLLNQVGGRAGRNELKSEVIIQTFNPDNYYLKCVQENDYEKFYKYEMHYRHIHNYPPYYFLNKIIMSSKDEVYLKNEIKKVYNYLKNNLLKETYIYEPTALQIYKMNNTYRLCILIKFKHDAMIPLALHHLDELYASNNKISFIIDTDPQH